MRQQDEKRGHLVHWEATAVGINGRVFLEDERGRVVSTGVIGIPGRYLVEMLNEWERERAKAAQLELPW